ncbi:hypothetical protein STA3757_30440 [Stanieria sp. NIES-3757]|nr:hypothetical protein STA3757_30440 [Stanieria sp. NIES-3757]
MSYVTPTKQEILEVINLLHVLRPDDHDLNVIAETVDVLYYRRTNKRLRRKTIENKDGTFLIEALMNCNGSFEGDVAQMIAKEVLDLVQYFQQQVE